MLNLDSAVLCVSNSVSSDALHQCAGPNRDHLSFQVCAPSICQSCASATIDNTRNQCMSEPLMPKALFALPLPLLYSSSPAMLSRGIERGCIGTWDLACGQIKPRRLGQRACRPTPNTSTLRTSESLQTPNLPADGSINRPCDARLLPESTRGAGIAAKCTVKPAIQKCLPFAHCCPSRRETHRYFSVLLPA